MSATLLMHAIRMVLNNVTEALKASVGPFLILIVALVVLAMVFGIPIGQITELNQMPDPTVATAADAAMAASFGIFALISMVLYLLTAVWVAVTWHRFILLGEYPATVPSMSGKPIMPYVGRSIVLVLIIILAAIPLFIVLGLVTSPFLLSAPLLAGGIIGIVAGAVLSFLWLRLAMSLPAIAIGKALTVSESWKITAPMSGVIFGVALLLMVMNLVLGIPGQVVGANIIGVVLDIIVAWFTLMVGVGILTTLYGHLVEGRELN